MRQLQSGADMARASRRAPRLVNDGEASCHEGSEGRLKGIAAKKISAPPAFFGSRAEAAAGAVTYAFFDSLRRAQVGAWAALGFKSRECGHSAVASDRLWRLREYDEHGDGPALLIVAAPIKRPYIWDLVPAASAVRICLARGLRVFLLEWLPALNGSGDAGLDAYAGQSLADAVARVTARSGGAKPFLMGHSLGGTFAAIHAALAGESLRGLVLLGAPLCFAPGSGRFRDALVSVMPASLGIIDIVPGSLLTHLCAYASPDIFIWSRIADAGLSLYDPGASAVHAGVERWTFDELSLPGRLVREIYEQLYRENRFCRGLLEIGGRRVGPAAVQLPTLAVVNVADEIAPPASITPFIEAMPKGLGTLIEHQGEVGVGLQHLAVLVGRKAHAAVWPRVLAWLDAQA